MFSMRIVCVDHYMGKPIPGLDVEYSDFRGVEVEQVPVVRVFGSSIKGEKTCLHVHGVYPYICIPCDDNFGKEDKLMYQIASSLDKALNISMGKSNSTVQHVFKIVLVSGVPFYGYHRKEHLFFKIYFYNPFIVKKATELLQNGAILNKVYQPHEAHIPYILQFMIDYNLYGMSLINLRNIRLRRDPENAGLLETFPEDIFLPPKITKLSTSELEVDTVAGDIINRDSIKDLALNPGLAAIWDDEKQRRREEGRTSQITPQNSQNRPFISSTGSEIRFKRQLHEKLIALKLKDSPISSTSSSGHGSSYPIETPEGLDLLQASFVNLHKGSSGSTSFVENQHDISIVNEEIIFGVTSSQSETASFSSQLSNPDSCDKGIIALLKKLEENADIDEDSILGSQELEDLSNCSNDCEDCIEDLSQPMELPKCETEHNCAEDYEDRSSDEREKEDPFWSISEEDIPQLDGIDDEPIKKYDRRFQRKRRKGTRKLFIQKNDEKMFYSNEILKESTVISTDMNDYENIVPIIPRRLKRKPTNISEFENESLERNTSPIKKCSKDERYEMASFSSDIRPVTDILKAISNFENVNDKYMKNSETLFTGMCENSVFSQDPLSYVTSELHRELFFEEAALKAFDDAVVSKMNECTLSPLKYDSPSHYCKHSDCSKCFKYSHENPLIGDPFLTSAIDFSANNQSVKTSFVNSNNSPVPSTSVKHVHVMQEDFLEEKIEEMQSKNERFNDFSSELSNSESKSSSIKIKDAGWEDEFGDEHTIHEILFPVHASICPDKSALETKQIGTLLFQDDTEELLASDPVIHTYDNFGQHENKIGEKITIEKGIYQQNKELSQSSDLNLKHLNEDNSSLPLLDSTSANGLNGDSGNNILGKKLLKNLRRLKRRKLSLSLRRKNASFMDKTNRKIKHKHGEINDSTTSAKCDIRRNGASRMSMEEECENSQCSNIHNCNLVDVHKKIENIKMTCCDLDSGMSTEIDPRKNLVKRKFHITDTVKINIRRKKSCSVSTTLTPCYVRLERLSLSKFIGLNKRGIGNCNLHEQQQCIFVDSQDKVSSKVHRTNKNKYRTITCKKAKNKLSGISPFVMLSKSVIISDQGKDCTETNRNKANVQEKISVNILPGDSQNRGTCESEAQQIVFDASCIDVHCTTSDSTFQNNIGCLNYQLSYLDDENELSRNEVNISSVTVSINKSGSNKIQSNKNINSKNDFICSQRNLRSSCKGHALNKEPVLCEIKSPQPNNDGTVFSYPGKSVIPGNEILGKEIEKESERYNLRFRFKELEGGRKFGQEKNLNKEPVLCEIKSSLPNNDGTAFGYPGKNVIPGNEILGKEIEKKSERYNLRSGLKELEGSRKLGREKNLIIETSKKVQDDCLGFLEPMIEVFPLKCDIKKDTSTSCQKSGNINAFCVDKGGMGVQKHEVIWNSSNYNIPVREESSMHGNVCSNIIYTNGKENNQNNSALVKACKCTCGKLNSECKFYDEIHDLEMIKIRTGKNCTFHRTMLLNSKQKKSAKQRAIENDCNCKYNLYSILKPLTINLVKLEQSELVRYSNKLISGQIKQGMCKKQVRKVNIEPKIPSVDGEFETSSSDDSSGIELLEEVDHVNLEKSGLTKRFKEIEDLSQSGRGNKKKVGDLQLSKPLPELESRSLRKQQFLLHFDELKRERACSTQSLTKSPKRNVYPPLTVKIQKSPKKNVPNKCSRTISTVHAAVKKGVHSSTVVDCKTEKMTGKHRDVSIKRKKKLSYSHETSATVTSEVTNTSRSQPSEDTMKPHAAEGKITCATDDKQSEIKCTAYNTSSSQDRKELETSCNKIIDLKEICDESHIATTLKERNEEVNMLENLNSASKLAKHEKIVNQKFINEHTNNSGENDSISNRIKFTEAAKVTSNKRGSIDLFDSGNIKDVSSVIDNVNSYSSQAKKLECTNVHTEEKEKKFNFQKRFQMSEGRRISEEYQGILSFYNDSITEEIMQLDPSKRKKLTSGINCSYQLAAQNNEESKFDTRILTPKYRPPTKLEILNTLVEFNISEHAHQKPYINNVLDVMAKKSMGNQFLKIACRSAIDLEPFTVSLHSIATIEELRVYSLQDFNSSQRNLELNKQQDSHKYTKSALAGYREVIIVPCKSSPSAVDVNIWLKQKMTAGSRKSKEENATAQFRKEIFVPLSPGQDGDSDDAMTLSIDSPSTPNIQNDMKIPSGNLQLHSTPENLQLLSTPENLQLLSTPENLQLPSTPNETLIMSNRTSSKKEIHPWKSLIRKSRKKLTLGQEMSISKTETECREEVLTLNESDICNIPENKTVAFTPKDPVIQNFRSVESGKSNQVQGRSPSNSSYSFRLSLGNLKDVKAVCEHQYLTTLIMELHFHTRGDLKPDPEIDPIRAIFYVVVNDVPEDSKIPALEKGVIYNCKLEGDVTIPTFREKFNYCNMSSVDDEISLILELAKIVKKWDPDILAGYEVEMLSWGYVFQRAFKLQTNLYPLMSRIPSEHRAEERNFISYDSEVQLPGRIILNVWRLMRHEVALQSYTFENMAYHILHQRIPHYTYKQLTLWWEHRTHFYRWLCIDYHLLRVMGIVKLLEQLDLIGRTSELARLFGIQFLEVLSRGSQFRVESMMLRLAKPLNYVSVSPNIHQRAKMRSPEFLPLIMEPDSRYYADPVIVLDFQSLYPSMIIAYNYCFSTCLGRVEHLGQYTSFPFGCTQLRVSPAEALHLIKDINISPCGVAFVKEGVRKGVLPRMLEEILTTRLMVKKSMKEHQLNKTLQRVLHSRQLGLKLIANVTYGYTSANFSGRMPCVEVGDSVVSKGRETLERAIHLVESTPRWRAEVVYGDTDSLFVLVPGRNREEAFKIGAEIAEAVTSDNPKPVKLKLEKVYQPCILQTKKRYVGYKYESPEQSKPEYEAKGIETVRRDGCPAVAKTLEKSLRILFDTQNMSVVKSYVCQQFTRIMQGKINLQDLIFAKEYRGMSGYKPGACVPALQLARHWVQTDKRAEPRQSERVPYVIVNGPPGIPLIRLVRSPRELLADPSLTPNVTYYITRVIIPALDRCFCLLGADVSSWYNDMPRKLKINLPRGGSSKNTISQHFATMNCAACGQLTTAGICLSCQREHQRTSVVLANKIQSLERARVNITKVCQSCCGHYGDVTCASLDCPILFCRNQASCDLHQVPYIRQLQEQYLNF